MNDELRIKLNNTFTTFLNDAYTMFSDSNVPYSTLRGDVTIGTLMSQCFYASLTECYDTD